MVDNDKRICNSSVKAQSLLSMTHMTENHGKMLLMKQSMSGPDKIQDDDGTCYDIANNLSAVSHFSSLVSAASEYILNESLINSLVLCQCPHVI